MGFILWFTLQTIDKVGPSPLILGIWYALPRTSARLPWVRPLTCYALPHSSLSSSSSLFRASYPRTRPCDISQCVHPLFTLLSLLPQLLCSCTNVTRVSPYSPLLLSSSLSQKSADSSSSLSHVHRSPHVVRIPSARCAAPQLSPVYPPQNNG